MLDSGIYTSHPEFGGRASVVTEFVDRSTCDVAQFGM